jgi:hypothetical protein
MADTVKLTAEDIAKLKAEAAAPLTPVEKEQLSANIKKAPDDKFAKEFVGFVLETRERWCLDTLRAQVEKGVVPVWVLDSGRAAEARGWMKEQGFQWRLDTSNPLWMAFYRGDHKIAELQIKVSGLEYETKG